MACYIAYVRTPRAPHDVFGFMADLRNFADWDPGVRRVVQVEGDGGGPDAVFDVTVRGGVRDLTLRYRTEAYLPPGRLVVVAETAILHSDDRIVVEPDEGGSIVTYDARLHLRGPLKIADGALQRSFDRIGERAASGLCEALDGERVER